MAQIFFFRNTTKLFSIYLSAKKYFKFFSGAIYLWKSNGMSDKSIKNITRSDKNLL